MEHDWPSTLEKVEDEVMEMSLNEQELQHPIIDGVVPDPIYAIPLAHPCDVKFFLPHSMFS
jgi:hypothetical protein